MWPVSSQLPASVIGQLRAGVREVPIKGVAFLAGPKRVGLVIEAVQPAPDRTGLCRSREGLAWCRQSAVRDGFCYRHRSQARYMRRRFAEQIHARAVKALTTLLLCLLPCAVFAADLPAPSNFVAADGRISWTWPGTFADFLTHCTREMENPTTSLLPSVGVTRGDHIYGVPGWQLAHNEQPGLYSCTMIAQAGTDTSPPATVNFAMQRDFSVVLAGAQPPPPGPVEPPPTPTHASLGLGDHEFALEISNEGTCKLRKIVVGDQIVTVP